MMLLLNKSGDKHSLITITDRTKLHRVSQNICKIVPHAKLTWYCQSFDWTGNSMCRFDGHSITPPFWSISSAGPTSGCCISKIAPAATYKIAAAKMWGFNKHITVPSDPYLTFQILQVLMSTFCNKECCLLIKCTLTSTKQIILESSREPRSTWSTRSIGMSPIMRLAPSAFSVCAFRTISVSVNCGHRAAIRIPFDLSCPACVEMVAPFNHHKQAFEETVNGCW